MTTLSTDVYANATTLISIIRSSVSAAPEYSTFSTLNIVGSINGSDVPSAGILLYPNINDAAITSPLSFLTLQRSSINASIPQLLWGPESDAVGSTLGALCLYAYSSAGSNMDMRVNKLWLGPTSYHPCITSDSHSTITIPYSSITGVSSINGVNFYGFVSTVKGLSPGP